MAKRNTSMIPSQVHVPRNVRYPHESAANQTMASTPKPLNWPGGAEDLTSTPQETNNYSGHFQHYSRTNGRKKE